MAPLRALAVGLVVVMQAACGGRQDTVVDTMSTMPAAEAPGAPAPGPAADPSSITAGQNALGDRIFQGQVAGGICWTCHGNDAAGRLTVAPNLTDSTWLHSDGSYGGIIATISAGVPKPKESSAPMPPSGGSLFTQEQLVAVAAYVYSLSHPEVRARRP